MIRLGTLLAVISTLILFWHECGEDLAVFCYRMGLGALTRVRAGSLVPAFRTQTIRRNRFACSNPSATFSTRSMTSKD
jgi:hypothetical protein